MMPFIPVRFKDVHKMCFENQNYEVSAKQKMMLKEIMTNLCRDRILLKHEDRGSYDRVFAVTDRDYGIFLFYGYRFRLSHARKAICL